MALMTACDKWEPDLNNDSKQGSLDLTELTVSLDTTENVVTRAGSAELELLLVSDRGDTVFTHPYAEAHEIFEVHEGTYTLIAQTAGAQAVDWDVPLFRGQTTVSIKEGETFAVKSIDCARRGARVSVSYSDNLREKLSGNYTATVSLNDNARLVFADGDARSGYFNSLYSPASLLVEFSGTVDGKEVKTSNILTDVKASDYFRLTYSLKRLADGSLTVTLDPEDPDINVDPNDPTITSTTLDLSKTTTLTMANVSTLKAVIDIAAPRGIEKLEVKIESDLLTADELANVGLAGEFDLAHPGDLAAPLAALGLPTGDQVLGKKEVTFDITSFLQLLVFFPGNNNFIITVTDTTGASRTQGVLFYVPAQ